MIFLLDLLKQGKKTSVFYSPATEEKVILENDLLVPFLYGENVRRYFISETVKYLLFPYQAGERGMELIFSREMSQKYPRIFDYLSRCKKLLMKRKVKLTSKDFYRYSAARSLSGYRHPKIMIPDMLVSLRIGYDSDGELFHGPAIHSVVFKSLPEGVSEKFYLALLNSKVFWFFLSHTSTALRGNAYRLTPEFIGPFCFPSPLNEKGNVKKQHDRLTSLVDQMLSAQAKRQASISESDRQLTEQRIAILDRQIDTLVYELYDLTEEERGIVEGENANR